MPAPSTWPGDPEPKGRGMGTLAVPHGGSVSPSADDLGEKLPQGWVQRLRVQGTVSPYSRAWGQAGGIGSASAHLQKWELAITSQPSKPEH